MKKTTTIARLILLLLATFFAVFSPAATLGDTLINLIPTFILVFILLTSYKFPKIAVIFLFLTDITFTILFTTYDYYLKFIVITVSLTISFFLLLIALILNTKDDIEQDDNDMDEDEVDKHSYR